MPDSQNDNNNKAVVDTEDKKESRVERELKNYVKEDVVGASDWKRSKVAYLTGISSVVKIGSTITNNLVGAATRTVLTWRMITATDNVPELSESQVTLEGHEKFKAACRLQNMTKQKIDRAIKNTHRIAFFYFALFIFAVAWFVVDLILKDSMRMTTVVLHVVPIFVVGAFIFKACYTNWMFRMRTLDSPFVFFKDRKNWFPQKSEKI